MHSLTGNHMLRLIYPIFMPISTLYHNRLKIIVLFSLTGITNFLLHAVIQYYIYIVIPYYIGIHWWMPFPCLPLHPVVLCQGWLTTFLLISVTSSSTTKMMHKWTASLDPDAKDPDPQKIISPSYSSYNLYNVYHNLYNSLFSHNNHGYVG